jgi:hypothetical protein
MPNPALFFGFLQKSNYNAVYEVCLDLCAVPGSRKSTVKCTLMTRYLELQLKMTFKLGIEHWVQIHNSDLYILSSWRKAFLESSSILCETAQEILNQISPAYTQEFKSQYFHK